MHPDQYPILYKETIYFVLQIKRKVILVAIELQNIKGKNSHPKVLHMVILQTTSMIFPCTLREQYT
jgi:hypothetical protein